MMVNERVVPGVVPLGAAIEEVDLFLLEPEQQAQREAEQKAQENLAGAMGLGMKIVGMPGA